MQLENAAEAAQPLRVPQVHPNLLRWNREMRKRAEVREDLEYVKRCAIERFASGRSPDEDVKVMWFDRRTVGGAQPALIRD